MKLWFVAFILIAGVALAEEVQMQVGLSIATNMTVHDRQAIKGWLDNWYGGELSELKKDLKPWEKNENVREFTWLWKNQLSHNGELTEAKIENARKTLNDKNVFVAWFSVNPKKDVLDAGWTRVN